MGIADDFLLAGLIPQPPKPNREKQKRRDEEAGAFRRLELDRQIRSSKKGRRKDSVESAEKKNDLKHWAADQRERAANNMAQAAQVELAAARRDRTVSVTPDE